jgi:hypothetical protein
VELFGIQYWISQQVAGIFPTDSLPYNKLILQNNKFERYAGTNIRGYEVKSLIRLVSASNEAEIFPQPINLTISTPLKNYDGIGTDSMIDSIKDPNKYTIIMSSYDDEYGYLTGITINENMPTLSGDAN